MKLVVVGGHSRNIGKTSVMAGIIAATPELAWTALKLTQFGHGVCSANGAACECAIQDPEHPFSMTQERNRQGRSDTSRFLAAGAAEAYWVRNAQGRLGQAMPAIREAIAGKPYVIMESNSVMRFVRPDLYLVVLDSNTADFKASARQHLDRADAFVAPQDSASSAGWPGVTAELLARRPVFRARPPDYVTAELLSFVTARLQRSNSCIWVSGGQSCGV